jgi:hypothetical protein
VEIIFKSSPEGDWEELWVGDQVIDGHRLKTKEILDFLQENGIIKDFKTEMTED